MSESGKSNKRLLPIAIAVALISFGLVKLNEYRSDQKERAAFETLADLEREMLKAGGPGVIIPDAGPRRVRSFADFYNYVATVRPSAVRTLTYVPTSQPADHSITSPNPFPGILPGYEYWINDSDDTAPEVEILRTRFRSRWGENYSEMLYPTGRAEWHFIPGE